MNRIFLEKWLKVKLLNLFVSRYTFLKRSILNQYQMKISFSDRYEKQVSRINDQPHEIQGIKLPIMFQIK